MKHKYTDRSHEQGDVNYAKRYKLREGTSSSQLSAAQQILPSPTFALKLHMILDRIEYDDSNRKSGISWLPHGRSFHIRNVNIFKREILPNYFKNCKMSSFYRQINLYGFIRLTTGCETGAYYHEYFLRGRAFLTKNIARTKVKGTKSRQTNAPKDEPNFNAMAPVCSIQQQSIEMHLGVVPSNDQCETPSVLLAAMREVNRINYANAESQNLRYNVPHNAIESAFLGGMASPHASVSHPSLLSLFNRDEYLADNLRSPYNETPRTINHDMPRTNAVLIELSRTGIQNEMLQFAAYVELTRAITQNEFSRSALQNDISRNLHTEISEWHSHSNKPHSSQEELQRIMHVPTFAPSSLCIVQNNCKQL